MNDQPEWADDLDDDEQPQPDPEVEADDDVPDDELERIATTGTADPAIEGMEGADS